jgi:hypothetical protein
MVAIKSSTHARGGADVALRVPGKDPGVQKALQLVKLRIDEQKAFLTYLSKLAIKAQLIEPEEFSTLIDLAVNHYGVAARALAETLDVAPSAISRWTGGENAPRSYARAAVLSAVSALLQEEIDGLQQKLANKRALLNQPST